MRGGGKGSTQKGRSLGSWDHEVYSPTVTPRIKPDSVNPAWRGCVQPNTGWFDGGFTVKHSTDMLTILLHTPILSLLCRPLSLSVTLAELLIRSSPSRIPLSSDASRYAFRWFSWISAPSNQRRRQNYEKSSSTLLVNLNLLQSPVWATRLVRIFLSGVLWKVSEQLISVNSFLNKLSLDKQWFPKCGAHCACGDISMETKKRLLEYHR